MLIKGLNHLAFITDDMTKTVRFYRDLLGMTLQAAFFEYAGASPMRRGESHDEPTREPIGFDHVSFAVESK